MKERIGATGAILHHLKTCKGITSKEAFELYGVTRLSAIIFNLRKAGFNIQSITRTGKTRYGLPCHFSEYRLKKD